jgi:hypothetical protein
MILPKLVAYLPHRGAFVKKNHRKIKAGNGFFRFPMPSGDDNGWRNRV